MNKVLKNQRGIALILVLWVVALLTVIVGEFCYAVRTEANITRNFKEETQAHYIAMSGFYWAVGRLVIQDLPMGGMQVLRAAEKKEGFQWRVNADMPAVPFGEGRFKVFVENESGKVNLNRAGAPLLKMALGRFGLEDAEKNIIADSVMDWRDKDHFHRLNGAEKDYYLALPDPYPCRDADFTSVGELLLVRGVTPRLFHGGLKDLVTVYPDTESVRTTTALARTWTSDYDRININAASPQMLLALPRMTDALARDIMKYREKKDFESLSDLRDIVGSEVYAAISPYVTLNLSPYYTVKSVGMLEDSHVRQGVQAVVRIDRTLAKGYEIVQWTDK